MLRASQINGDGYATDVWSKNAAHAGENATRVNLVTAWRESTVFTVFTDAERAALEVAEQGTRLADPAGGVTDEAWADAAKHHGEHRLSDLVMLIALINATNCMSDIVRQRGGELPARLTRMTRANDASSSRRRRVDLLGTRVVRSGATAGKSLTAWP